MKKRDINSEENKHQSAPQTDENGFAAVEEAEKEENATEDKGFKAFIRDKKKVVRGYNGSVALKRTVGREGVVCILVFVVLFGLLGSVMGMGNLINTLFANAYDLLINTVFNILALAVVAGAISYVFTEFGVIAMANKLLAPLMKPLYGMPGASIIGIFACYMSDNPAILSLAEDKKFRCYFKKYQFPALCNMGTAFGMGLIVTVYMLKVSGLANFEHSGLAVLMGNLGAIVGSIVSCRIMMIFTKKLYGKEQNAIDGMDADFDILKYREIRQGGVMSRLFDALLEGGASGVKVGVSVIPGVLIICNFVLILIGSQPAGGYTGGANEGIDLISKIGGVVSAIFDPLFGFQSPNGIAVPLTALGSAGAAVRIVDSLLAQNLANVHDIAVFTSICMCWSGYLSTHVAMMDSLKCRELTGKAILSHTIGGICAGIFTNYAFKLIMLLI